MAANPREPAGQDNLLITAIQQGPTEEAAGAFRVLYTRYAGRLSQLCRAWGLTSNETEDVCSETWARALKAISRYEDRGLPFLSYLRGIARRVRLELLKQEVRAIGIDLAPEALDEIVDPFGETDVLERLEQTERLQLIGTALTEAPQDYRLAIEASLEGWTAPEIAEIHGWTMSKTYTTHHRALVWLRKSIAAQTRPAATTMVSLEVTSGSG